MRQRLLCAYVLLGALACAWSVGCSKGASEEGPTVIVSGRLTNAGQPLEAKEGSTIEVVLAPYAEAGAEVSPNAYRVSPDDKGNFRLTGRFGNGVVLGKYRIAVYQWEKAAPGDKSKDLYKGKRDTLQKKFSDKTSPFIREISRSNTTLDIDISKPEG